MICCACNDSDNTESNSYFSYISNSFLAEVMETNLSDVSCSNDQTDSILLENQNESTSVSTVNLNLKKKGMNFGFINIQGICGNELSKFSEINLMLTSETMKNLHAFCFCETKLKEHKISSALTITGFHKPFRKDNLKTGDRGIIVYVRKDLTVKRRADLEINDIECLWLEITPEKGKSF